MKTVLPLVAVLSAGIVAAADLAWWLTVSPRPEDPGVYGLAAAKLPVPLTRVSLLSCRRGTSQFKSVQCEEIGSNAAAFQLSGDFNHDGKPEMAETAVGELPSGEIVSVLFIRTLGARALPHMLVQRGNGFSVLYNGPLGLAWSTCMECGGATSIRWSKKLRRYVELAPESYGAEPSNNSSKPTPLRGAA